MWSVGCILYEIATKQVLFDGDSEVEQLFKILQMVGSYDPQTVQMIQSETRSDNGNGDVVGVPCKATPMPKWERIDFVRVTRDYGYFE